MDPSSPALDLTGIFAGWGPASSHQVPSTSRFGFVAKAGPMAIATGERRTLRRNFSGGGLLIMALF